MKRFIKILYICTIVLFTAFIVYERTPHYNELQTENSNEINKRHSTCSENAWDKFIEAIIWKESRGNENCIGDNGRAVGVLQIHPVMVREANRILRMNGEEEKFTYDDMYSKEKSIEMFNVVQDFHNKNHDFDRALQIWNKNHPASYRTLIMNKYNELMSD